MLRSRENSDLQPSTTPQDSMWISQIFHRYRLPEHLGCDSIDPVDGCTHRIQSRLLGFSSLKLGLDTFSNCAFYEIKEWEIAFSDHSKKTSCSSPDVSLSPETYGDSVTAAVAAAGFRPSPERTDIVGKFDTAPAALFEAMDTSLRAVAASGPGYTATEQPSCALPPKKRRHRRMVRYDVVFCFVGAVYPADSAYPCPDYDYYLFPSDAMVEAVNSAPPFEVLCTFHPKTSPHSTPYDPQSPEEDDLRSYPRSHSPYRSPQKTPGDQKADNWHGMNMILAGVSSELHLAIQQAVSGFEALYHKLTELRRLHMEQMNCQKSEVIIPCSSARQETPIKTPKHAFDTWNDSDESDWGKDQSMAIEEDAVTLADGFDHSMEWYDAATVKSPPSPPSAAASLSSGSTKTSPSLSSRPATTPTTITSTPAHSAKKCLYCGSKSTPMWRRGPQGAGTLCNACGVKWKHGKILNVTEPYVAPTKDQSQQRSAKGSDKRKRTHSVSSRKDKRKAKQAKKELQQQQQQQEEEEEEEEEEDKPVSFVDTLDWDSHHQSSPSFSLSLSCSPSFDISLISPDSTGLHGMDSHPAFPMVGVDVVEAAAVLALLKRG